MPSTPIGGGIDGPNYADYQDVTDQQQTAGASSAMKEKLLLTQDTLTLDIAKFSGDLKSYAAKAEAPIIAPYIKARSAGPLETTTADLEQVEEEFVRMIEQLPPKLRVLLLKNMNLPKAQRNPDLDGLERSLQQHVAVRLWARNIIQRFRRNTGEEDEEEEEHKGIFDQEDEEVLPADTVIPKTQYVPISALKTHEMTDDELKKQIQSNTLFMLESQYGILKMHVKSLRLNDPAKPILDPLPRLMARMIKQAKAFVDLANMLDFKKAQKIAIGLERLDSSIVDEQRVVLERARSYSAGGPSNPVIELAKAMLGITIVGCNILRSDASLSSLSIEGIALLQALLLSSTPLMGNSLIMMLNSLSRGLMALGEPENKAKVLEIAMLVANTLIMVLSGQEAIPHLVAFQPEIAEGLAAMEVEEEAIEDDEDKEEPELNLQDLARTTAVQLASGTLLAREAAKTAIVGLTKKKSEITTSFLEFTLLFGAATSAQTLLQKIGGTGSALYAALVAQALHASADKLQHLADAGALKISVAQVVNELRLGELSHQEAPITELLAAREKTIEGLGLHLKDFAKAQEDQLLLSALLILEFAFLSHQRRQVVPSMNVVI